MTKPISTEEMRQTATNLRKMASDPRVKVLFPSAVRKSFNDCATGIMAGIANAPTDMVELMNLASTKPGS
jgi:hypothetical protein